MKFETLLPLLSGGFGQQLEETILHHLPADARISRSPLGNLYAQLSDGFDRTVLLDAHMDEVCFVVTAVTEDGFVKVGPCGGIDCRVLPGCQVTVWGKTPLYGVFCNTPPHLKKASDTAALPVEQTAIDVGLKADRAREQIRPGDRVTFAAAPVFLQNGRLAAKSLDNRAGVAVLLRVAELMEQSDNKPPVNLILQFSTMEETGGRYAGAVTGTFAWQPDEAIVVDASFAEYPGVDYPTPGKLGGGAMIGFSPLLSHRISDRLRQVAQANALPYTEEVLGGRTGTNADAVSTVAAGIPTGLVSYPLRNMHTPVETVELQDLETVARLLYAYLCQGGALHA